MNPTKSSAFKTLMVSFHRASPSFWAAGPEGVETAGNLAFPAQLGHPLVLTAGGDGPFYHPPSSYGGGSSTIALWPQNIFMNGGYIRGLWARCRRS